MGFTLNDAPKGIVVMQRCEDGSWKKLGEVDSIEIDHSFETLSSSFRADGFICDDDSEYVLDKRENVSYSATFEVKPSEDVLEFFKMALGDSGQSKRSKYRASLPKKVIVSGPCVICIWQDGTKTISRCHDGDEMDVKTGVLLCALKRWMPGGSYWLDVMDGMMLKGLDKYYDTKRQPAGYASYVNTAPQSDRFYDDNIWLGIDMADLRTRLCTGERSRPGITEQV